MIIGSVCVAYPTPSVVAEANGENHFQCRGILNYNSKAIILLEECNKFLIHGVNTIRPSDLKISLLSVYLLTLILNDYHPSDTMINVLNVKNHPSDRMI